MPEFGRYQRRESLYNIGAMNSTQLDYSKTELTTVKFSTLIEGW